MKSQILLYFIVLFFVSSIAAQPGLYGGFNPDNLCKYKEGKIIFVGRVISIEEVSISSIEQKVLNDPGSVSLKTTVSIENVINGQFQLKEIREVFVKGWKFPHIEIGEEHIFVAEEVNLNGSKVLSAIDWSRKLNEYSKEEKSVRFSRIEARMNRFPKSPPLSGIVLENYVKPTKVSLEVSVIYGDEVEKHTPVAGVTVVAKSKKSRQVFRTETKENGVFTFDNLEDGDYALSIVVPKGFEQVFRLEQHKYQEIVIPITKDSCGSAVIFKIQKAKKF